MVAPQGGSSGWLLRLAHSRSDRGITESEHDCLPRPGERGGGGRSSDGPPSGIHI